MPAVYSTVSRKRESVPTARALGNKTLKPADPKDDEAAFAEAVQDVKPLPPHKLAELRRDRTLFEAHSRGLAKPDDDDGGCVSKGGIQRGVLRKIRNGQLPVEAELDLHGCTVQQAKVKVHEFLQQNRIDRQRVIRIIHGKGRRSPDQQSILRTKVTEWLYASDDVLAFCPAGPSDGGSGAVRVLLKRS